MSEFSVRLSHAGPRNLHRLVDAVLSIGTELDLETVLRRIVEVAVDLVDARYGALGVLDEGGQRLAQFITVGIDAETHEAIGALPKGLGLLGSLITDAHPLRVAQLDEHPDSAGFPLHHPPMQSFLGVPIRVRGEVFGNLYLTDKTSAEVFSDVDEELALGLAAAAGVAIENARLYDRARRRELMVSALHRVATAVLEDSGAGTGLAVVARAARDLLGAIRTSVSLLDGDDHLRVEVADGEETEDLVGFRWAYAGTPCGDVLAGAPSLAVEDATEIARIGQAPLREGHVGPALFVALAAGDASFGMLTIARRRGARGFTPAEIELAEAFASQASIVLDHERGREQRDRVTRLEDQERIARALHGTVVQRLYTAGLALEGAARLTDDAAVRDRVLGAVAELDRTIAEIRAVVFDAGPRPTGTD